MFQSQGTTEYAVKVKVKNVMGLHTRPATAIAKLLQGCKSEVTFTYKKRTANAKSILSLLMLEAGKNAWITVNVQGEDAQQVMQQVIAAFENEFGV